MVMKSRTFVLALLVGSCVGTHPVDAAEVMVVLKNFDYSPLDLTVAAGTTVVWKNLDGEPHTIADRLFRSPPLDENDSFRFTFDKPGIYKYTCSIHPRMKAEITVK
jgi:plastocyanin